MSKSKKNKEKEDEFLNNVEHKLIFKKYIPIHKIGSGSFSSVYFCENILTKKQYAMKVEKRDAKLKFLETEAYHLLILKNFGIPECVSFGHTKTHNILIETLLGYSLLKKFKDSKTGLKLIDICLCALQILDRIEWVHSKNMIHRDIKPENFLFGIKDPDVLYLIDFGLCKKYRSDKTGKHMMPKLTGKFNGTVRYASVNSLKGKECSRRDDLISIGYMLIYLKNYELPWKDDPLYAINKTQYLQMIKDRKIKSDVLCQGLPDEFSSYIKYVYSLKFEQDPNYDYLKSLFKQLLNNLTNNPKNDNLIFSWLGAKKIKVSQKRNNSLKRISSPQNRLLQKIKLDLEEKNKSEIFTQKNINDSDISKKLKITKSQKIFENFPLNYCNNLSEEYHSHEKIKSLKILNNKSNSYINSKLKNFSNKKIDETNINPNFDQNTNSNIDPNMISIMNSNKFTNMDSDNNANIKIHKIKSGVFNKTNNFNEQKSNVIPIKLSKKIIIYKKKVPSGLNNNFNRIKIDQSFIGSNRNYKNIPEKIKTDRNNQFKKSSQLSFDYSPRNKTNEKNEGPKIKNDIRNKMITYDSKIPLNNSCQILNINQKSPLNNKSMFQNNTTINKNRLAQFKNRIPNSQYLKNIPTKNENMTTPSFLDNRKISAKNLFLFNINQGNAINFTENLKILSQDKDNTNHRKYKSNNFILSQKLRQKNLYKNNFNLNYLKQINQTDNLYDSDMSTFDRFNYKKNPINFNYLYKNNK